LSLKHSATILWPDSIEMLIELLLRQNRHVVSQVFLLVNPDDTTDIESQDSSRVRRYSVMETVSIDEQDLILQEVTSRLTWSTNVIVSRNPARILIPFIWSRLHHNPSLRVSLAVQGDGVQVVADANGQETYVQVTDKTLTEDLKILSELFIDPSSSRPLRKAKRVG
jgi:hypothetical protein